MAAIMNFKEQEQKERETIVRLMEILKPKQYIMSEIGSYEVWDFFCSYGGDRRYIGEMKCRGFEHDCYEWIFLEEKKAKNLIWEAYKTGISKPALYVSHYSDDVCRIVKLTPSLLCFYKPCWRTVKGVKKLIYMIPNKESSIIRL